MEMGAEKWLPWERRPWCCDRCDVTGDFPAKFTYIYLNLRMVLLVLSLYYDSTAESLEQRCHTDVYASLLVLKSRFM